MKRFLFWMVYVAGMILLVVAVDYVLYLNYIAELRDRNKPEEVRTFPNVSPELMNRAGFIGNYKATSFGTAAPEKPAGTIRIGAFGDSFTQGDEVDATSDYPSQLARLFAAAGMNDVQVINFGVNGHGFGQTYMMWDDLAERFGIDIVLLGPGTFYYDRMTKFGPFRDYPYVLSARYVLDGEDLSLVDVLGTKTTERFENYYGFIPPWRYLRYDRNDPPFLAAALPEGRTLGNPFYYSALSEKDEAVEIQRRLITKVLAAGKPVIAGVHSEFPEVLSAITPLSNNKFCAFPIERLYNFPYFAPSGHYSPAANYWLALQYFAVITGNPIELPIISSSDLIAPDAAGGALADDLAAYDTVRVMMNGIEAGRFIHSSGRIEPATFLHEQGIRSLVSIKAGDKSIADGIFLALPIRLDDKSRAILQVPTSSGEKEYAIAEKRQIGSPNFVSLDLPLSESGWKRAVLLHKGELTRLTGAELTSGELRLMIADRVIAAGTVSDAEDIELRPAAAEFYFLDASDGGELMRPGTPDSGTIELALSTGGQEARIPIAQWSIDRKTINPVDVCGLTWNPSLKTARIAQHVSTNGSQKPVAK